MTESAGATVAAATTVFCAQGITKVYHMGEVDVHALRGVDLELGESEFLVLLGPSGSGKSTLRNIRGGLDVPSAGRVSYRGRAVRRAIDIGRRNGLEAEVLSGLSAGDRVVVHPSDAVVDGVEVVERTAG